MLEVLSGEGASMLLPLLKSLAVVLGAIACGLALFGFMEIRGRKANRSSILKRLHTTPLRTEPSHAHSLRTAPLQAGSLPAASGEGKAHAVEQRNRQEDSMPALRAVLRRIPFLAQRLEREEQQRMRSAYRAELPRMFEIIALGMRVGLGFDQAFALYVRGFQTSLAVLCRERFEVWECGLISRETGLRELGVYIGLKEFDRFISLVLRALDYGAPLAHLLGDLAHEARKAYRAERQEMVAKAPVKMLIPTGVFILPAMMMLVLGPIVLDITERMV